MGNMGAKVVEKGSWDWITEDPNCWVWMWFGKQWGVPKHFKTYNYKFYFLTIYNCVPYNTVLVNEGPHIQWR